LTEGQYHYLDFNTTISGPLADPLPALRVLCCAVVTRLLQRQLSAWRWVWWCGHDDLKL